MTSARYEVTWARTYESGLEEIVRGGYDICLLDYHLGSENGLDILARVCKINDGAPDNSPHGAGKLPGGS